MLDKKINLNDDSLYVEKNEGTINYFQNNKELSTEEALDSLEEASIDLTSYTNKFNGEIHLKRSETILGITRKMIGLQKIMGALV